MTGAYSLYWWDRDGGQHDELRDVDGQTAVLAARRLTHGPASVAGIVRRVIITDDGDFINFEWRAGEGVTYPTAADITASRKEEQTHG